mmetsp:Transcript_135213/g.376719  ORF Transcript_135213/g.376719 Transcript_135213/m.376719 type:complete len:217 (+) Transcript_135213:310-960(+)
MLRQLPLTQNLAIGHVNGPHDAIATLRDDEAPAHHKLQGPPCRLPPRLRAQRAPQGPGGHQLAAASDAAPQRHRAAAGRARHHARSAAAARCRRCSAVAVDGHACNLLGSTSATRAPQPLPRDTPDCHELHRCHHGPVACGGRRCAALWRWARPRTQQRPTRSGQGALSHPPAAVVQHQGSADGPVWASAGVAENRHVFDRLALERKAWRRQSQII